MTEPIWKLTDKFTTGNFVPSIYMVEVENQIQEIFFGPVSIHAV